ncbi:hypothetical protein BU25DRAFT_412392 [Macroventuria anomochaeta]|uniref:Uncharacterized protein n=1 Tax=Macroventuria anomochaeta TaxID=301207 RepID=A0ACB6RUY1_9PLEO|nr:uncharacterized protein BU25DRAFT_412392 [Macroventuria anomochaeta]KAF2625736.1 hypothetical protein BU25DRAFT_412392 [Macroventuria anomochaeta]
MDPAVLCATALQGFRWRTSAAGRSACRPLLGSGESSLGKAAEARAPASRLELRLQLPVDITVGVPSDAIDHSLCGTPLEHQASTTTYYVIPRAYSVGQSQPCSMDQERRRE